MIERRAAPLALVASDPGSAAAVTGSGRRISGVGVPFGPTADLGAFVERFAASAFDAQAADGWKDVQVLYSHEPPLVLGSVNAGTARFDVTPTGLRYSVDMPSSLPYVTELVGRGDVAGASVGFVVVQDEWSRDGTVPFRTVRVAVLAEVSLTATPAYRDTSALLAAGPRSVSTAKAARRGSFDPVRSLRAREQVRRRENELHDLMKGV